MLYFRALYNALISLLTQKIGVICETISFVINACVRYKTKLNKHIAEQTRQVSRSTQVSFNDPIISCGTRKQLGTYYQVGTCFHMKLYCYLCPDSFELLLVPPFLSFFQILKTFSKEACKNEESRDATNVRTSELFLLLLLFLLLCIEKFN